MMNKAQAEPGQADLPPELQSARLVSAKTCAAVGDVSVSWWHGKVREGVAPQPAFRATSCTRWNALEVLNFWNAYARQRAGDAAAAGARVELARRASAKAVEMRKKNRQAMLEAKPKVTTGVPA